MRSTRSARASPSSAIWRSRRRRDAASEISASEKKALAAISAAMTSRLWVRVMAVAGPPWCLRRDARDSPSVPTDRAGHGLVTAAAPALLHEPDPRPAAGARQVVDRAPRRGRASRALPKPVISARRISRGARVARWSSTSSGRLVGQQPAPVVFGADRAIQVARDLPRLARARAPRSRTRSCGCRMGSGMPRSSFAVVIQMIWLASIGTSANSSTKACAVSCSSRL